MKCVRIVAPQRPEPQLIATGRHVTGGGVDLDEVRWDGAALSGKSRAVPGDPYVLYLTEPAGYRMETFEPSGAEIEKIDRDGLLVRVALAPRGNGTITWLARYSLISNGR